MAYTAIDNPELYFQTVLYQGNSGTLAVTLDGSVDMQPDWVWIKARSGTDAVVNHALYDSVRGTSKQLKANNTSADLAQGGITSFDSDGFTLGSYIDANYNGNNCVAWCWKAGTAFSNDASATSVGSIDSAGSVNTDAGFSIIGYTGAGDGSGSSAQTVAHGLGVAPEMIIVKNRADATNWYVYHHKNTAAPATDVLYLNLDSATADDDGPWNDVAPTSSVFTVGGDNGTNGNGDGMIAYCFAEKQGYSKFGSYTGNGNADGAFIYLGFKPVFCMFRNTTGDKWSIFDGVRNTFNEVDNNLRPNLNEAEVDQANKEVDFLSNGIKIRTSSGEWNGSGHNLVFMAFAENPFVNSNKVPTNAR